MKAEKPRKGNLPSVHAVLLRELDEATERVSPASMELNAIMRDVPSRIPQPDGIQHMQYASHALSVARKEVTAAYDRLNAYLERGIVPEDLKRNG